MANYYVSKDLESGKWRIKNEDADRISDYARTQKKAEDIAKDLSSNSGGGEVVIFKPHGGIRDKDTVPPAKDPFSPRDKRH